MVRFAPSRHNYAKRGFSKQAYMVGITGKVLDGGENSAEMYSPMPGKTYILFP